MITLTPAELLLIEVTREKAALELKEKNLKLVAIYEKEVLGLKEDSRKLTELDNAQEMACRVYQSDLGSGWSMVTRKWDDTLFVKGEYTSPEKPSINNYEREIIHTEVVPRRESKLVKAGYKWTVEVKLHRTVKSRSLSAPTVTRGYKMFLSGAGLDYKQHDRPLSRASSVNSKITESVTAELRKNSTATKAATSLETTISKMKEKFPDAKSIISGTDSERVTFGHNKTKYEEHNKVTIEFHNGIRIVYRVYTDGSLGRKELTIPVADSWEFMDVMNNITVKEKVSAS